jgi:hypothetical protein
MGNYFGPETGRNEIAPRQASKNLTKRSLLTRSETFLTAANDQAVRRVLESAGVEFIDENGGGPGVRWRKRQQRKR